MKICGQCGASKPLDEFYSVKRTGGTTSACKQCVRSNSAKWRKDNPERFKDGVRQAQLRREHGIDATEYDDLLKQQNGLCALCDLPPSTSTSSKKARRLGVDKHPETGLIRGLLCPLCSSGISLFGHSPERLIRAAQYVEVPR